MPVKDDKVELGAICEAIFTWSRIMSERLKEDQLNEDGWGQAQNVWRLNSKTKKHDQYITPSEVMGNLPLWMTKSNLLYRLIYLGEPLRTEKCPIHKGQWSGCRFFQDPCDCQKIILPDGRVVIDSNVTGWLLEGNPPIDKKADT